MVNKQLRAYPNTSAKWKMLEPNELTLAMVLARKKYQKIVLYFPLVANCLLITFANSLDPDQARQNVDIEKIQHPNSKIWHNNKV